MKKIKILFFSLILLFPEGVLADEGMWLLPLLDELNIGTMTEMGLQLTAEDIYSANRSSLKDAIVRFGRGCTGSIISEQGLLLTNHHCGYGSIQEHSTPEHNYLEDGFWAMSLEEELPNPGLTVTFLIAINDVSDRINSQLSEGMTEEERADKIREMSLELESEAVEGTNYEADVRSFYGGNQFCLFVYEVFKDVRFVGAPPSSIGKFGYDTDNWVWPRHTGDFSLFRVYMSPDGKPAEYSPDNIPLKPKHYLPVSIHGIDENDFAMILGYPGGTQRYMTSYEVDEVLSITHPNRIKIRGARQEILWHDMMADEKVRIQYSSKYSGSSNYWKFSIGQSRSLKKLGVRKEKEALEQRFREWIKEDAERQEKYGEVLDLIRSSIEGRAEYQRAGQYLNECLIRGSEIINAAYRLNNLYDALTSGDKEEIKKETENSRENLRDFFKDYHAPTDRKVVKVMIRLYTEDIDKKYQPEALVDLYMKNKGDVEKLVDKMFDKSLFATEEKAFKFLNDPDLKTLEKDIAFILAKAIREKQTELRNESRSFNRDYNRGHRLYVEGLMEMQKDKIFYPDANSTMRLTYGTVLGYNAQDAVNYHYYTTLKGVMEKEDPEDFEFIVDENLKKLYAEKDYGRYGLNGQMTVCFLTNNDITGGNSGSPVLNANGELIGAAFDGNWEAMSGDIIFEPGLQRTIAVDIRYVLFIMDKYAGASHLVDELNIVE